MRIHITRPGHEGGKEHLQPGIYLRKVADALALRGHEVTLSAAPPPATARRPDAAVWCLGPTSMVGLRASKVRGSAETVAAFLPGPIYDRHQLKDNLGSLRRKSFRDHAVHIASSYIPERLFGRYLRRAVGQVLVPTTALASQMLDFGVPRERFHLAPPGLDPQVPATPDAHAARLLLRDLDLEKRQFVVNFGPVRPVRGVDTLVEAARLLPDGIQVLVLARGGDGKPLRDLAWLRRTIARHDVGRRVTVHPGRLGRGALMGVVARARVAVFPLRIVQSIVPLAVHEALQLGVPVAGSDVEPLASLLHGPHGATARVGDADLLARAITRLDGDRDAAVKGCKAWVAQQPTWEDVAMQWESVLQMT